MDFAARLKGHQSLVVLTHELVVSYAKHAGLGGLELTNTVLPALKNAGLIDYRIDAANRISNLEEYVGVSATVTEQTVALLDSLGPQRSDLAFLHSVEIGAIAPLAASQHLDQIVKRGFTEQEAEDALRLARAVGLNLDAPSDELNELVVFSPYVWGTKQLSLATFLGNMSEQVLSTPGLHLSKLNANPAIIRSAQNVGLIQAATVQSATGASSTYVFSPLLEVEDNTCTTTEAFHLRKLFVAHMLFGRDSAAMGGGRIDDPAVLVNALLRKGMVGPATNIGTDYHLLEAAGVVAVEPNDQGRAFLRLVKPEIAESALTWIRRITDTSGTADLTRGQRPATFITPEDGRTKESLGASHEIMVASIHELRKEMQRAARRDDPWA